MKTANRVAREDEGRERFGVPHRGLTSNINSILQGYYKEHMNY